MKILYKWLVDVLETNKMCSFVNFFITHFEVFTNLRQRFKVEYFCEIGKI